MPLRPPSHRPVKGNRLCHNPNPIVRLAGSGLLARNARLRRRDPLCKKCREVGVVRLVFEFDHVIPLWKGGVDHESNIQGLCKEHHDQKTALEAADRAAHGRPAFRRPTAPVGFA